MSAKPCLVLLPGLDGSGELFFPLLPLLEPDFDVRVVHYRDEIGFEDYVATAEHALPTDAPVSLVAESFSGPIAIRLLADARFQFMPSVLSATFCCSPLPWLTGLGKRLPARLFRDNVLSRFALDVFTGGRGSDAAVRRKSHELLHSVGPQRFHSRIGLLDEIDLCHRVAEIDVPMLYIQAEQDRIVPKRCARSIEAAARRLTLARVDGPHMILQSRPAECASLIHKHVMQNALSSSR